MWLNASSFKGVIISREENCRSCNERTGQQIGLVDYWDIKTARLVQCPKCRHIQLDPMLNEEETAKGCHAYFVEESLRTSKNEQIKNCERNFRRGVVFGYKLKRMNISPRSVLELGPGTGYFSEGLKFVFPDLQVTVMDINREVLEFNRQQHGFDVLQGIPDHFITNCSGKFDLVIARDILEHVTDISKVVNNIYEYLRPGGILHFITPNGKEDVWGHYLAYKLEGTASELLINHVNYFDGKGLEELLIRQGFRNVEYFTYTVKTYIRGKGWKESRKLINPLSTKKSADLYISKKSSETGEFNFDKWLILNKWYISNRYKIITRAWCLLHHYIVFKIRPERNTGHEIYGLFRKV